MCFCRLWSLLTCIAVVGIAVKCHTFVLFWKSAVCFILFPWPTSRSAQTALCWIEALCYRQPQRKKSKFSWQSWRKDIKNLVDSQPRWQYQRRKSHICKSMQHPFADTFQSAPSHQLLLDFHPWQPDTETQISNMSDIYESGSGRPHQIILTPHTHTPEKYLDKQSFATKLKMLGRGKLSSVLGFMSSSVCST